MHVALRVISSIVLLIDICYNTNASGQYVYDNWKFHFPSGSGMGLFVAVAIPLELKGTGAFVAYNFEANYPLPFNETHLEYPPLIQRESKKFNIDRRLVYDALESKIQSYGYSGRGCLLRTICEASVHTMHHANGILGDILHILFTPSSSKNDEVLTVYEKAEKTGGDTKNCTSYYKKCPISLLDLVTWIGHVM